MSAVIAAPGRDACVKNAIVRRQASSAASGSWPTCIGRRRPSHARDALVARHEPVAGLRIGLDVMVDAEPVQRTPSSRPAPPPNTRIAPAEARHDRADALERLVLGHGRIERRDDFHLGAGRVQQCEPATHAEAGHADRLPGDLRALGEPRRVPPRAGGRAGRRRGGAIPRTKRAMQNGFGPRPARKSGARATNPVSLKRRASRRISAVNPSASWITRTPGAAAHRRRERGRTRPGSPGRRSARSRRHLPLPSIVGAPPPARIR